MFSYEVLQVIWWILVIVLLSGFAIFDGFDLGALALNPFVAKTDAERRVIINTIAPHWDGNQVWLLLGGGAIFAAWPEVYATSFSGLYLGMILILAALYFRPVGLEYRGKFESESLRRKVDFTLFLSGFIPPLVVGVALGNTLLGLPFEFNAIGQSFYGKGEFFLLNLIYLLNPFALVFGVFTLSVFLLQGAAWILLRTDKKSAIYARTSKVAGALATLLVVLFVVIAVWLYFIDGYFLKADTDLILAAQTGQVEVGAHGWYQNYLAHPYLFVLPLLVVLTYAYSAKLIKAGKDALLFTVTSVGILLAFSTYAVSLFPFVLPSSVNPHQSLTIWNATSSVFTLEVMFYVAVVFTPLVLAYTAWCYYKMWARLTTKDVEEQTHALY